MSMGEEFRFALLEWERFADRQADGVAHVLAHPRFGETARAFAANMLEITTRDRALGAVCKDAGRYFTAGFAIHLHLVDELTLPRLTDACVMGGVASPGRVRAIVQFLMDHEWLTVDVHASTRATRYVPTDAFIASWCAHIRAALSATREMEPEVSALVALLARRDTAELCIRKHHALMLRAARDYAGNTPLMLHLLHHDAGSSLSWLLLSRGSDGDFPPRSFERIALATLARRFDVSRAHLRRLLREAVAAGVLEVNEKRAVRFAPASYDAVRALYAHQILLLLTAAASTLRLTFAEQDWTGQAGQGSLV